MKSVPKPSEAAQSIDAKPQIAVIAVITILVVGPEKLKELAKEAGKATPELKEAYDEAMAGVEALDEERSKAERLKNLKTQERDSVLRCFMGAPDLIGMDVATAQAALIAAGNGIYTEDLRGVIDGLVREGELFSTIDEDTFAVTVDPCDDGDPASSWDRGEFLMFGLLSGCSMLLVVPWCFLAAKTDAVNSTTSATLGYIWREFQARKRERKTRPSPGRGRARASRGFEESRLRRSRRSCG